MSKSPYCFVLVAYRHKTRSVLEKIAPLCKKDNFQTILFDDDSYINFPVESSQYKKYFTLLRPQSKITLYPIMFLPIEEEYSTSLQDKLAYEQDGVQYFSFESLQIEINAGKVFTEITILMDPTPIGKIVYESKTVRQHFLNMFDNEEVCLLLTDTGHDYLDFLDKKNKRIYYNYADYMNQKPYYDETSNIDKLAPNLIRSKEVIVSSNYNNIGYLNHNLFKVKQKGLWGIINASGEEIHKPSFESVEDCYDKFTAFKLGDKWGFLDEEGQIVIKPTFESVKGFSQDFASVSTNGKYGFIDKDGKWAIQPSFDNTFYFNESGHAIVQEGSRVGVINRVGEISIPCKYDEIELTKSNIVNVSHNFLWGVSDTQGYEIIPIEYDYPFYFYEGLSVFTSPKKTKKKKKRGFMNTHGEIAIPPKFEHARNFSEGLACVKKNDKYGFIDKSGKFVINPCFNKAEDFLKGLSRVTKNGNSYFIDKNGDEFYNQPSNHNRSINMADK